jgi:hypothetical protein
MATPSQRRLARVTLPPSGALNPDALDETVVHDASGRPWLVCTTDRLYWRMHLGELPETELLDAELPDACGPTTATGVDRAEGSLPQLTWKRYETQVYYTARAGVRGFPTGHGQRYERRDAAIAGHRQWCLRVRTGEVEPDRLPDNPL